jgi:hypothetical protein
METDATVDRLDRILAILRIAHADEIDAVRTTARAHPVDAAILDATEDWTAGGDLRREVAKKSGQSERNVTNRFAALIALGALEKRGDGRATMYRSTGLL